ncbi:pilus assembly protein TadG-related protein [Pleomorphomonas oryzae]|uniref:pilus assembly protein TadG-related protein n=1 Tax=Pleomorphomonas oryzae TaxID=261934 RepID=UPI00041EE621|nr:pilus assembly protein TadG-related protein [Pleomorphomonas oryzae]
MSGLRAPQRPYGLLDLEALAADIRGSIGVVMAIALVVLVVAVGAAVDLAQALRAREILQSALDQATIRAALTTGSGYVEAGRATLIANLSDTGVAEENLNSSFVRNSDGSVSGAATVTVPLSFMAIVGKNDMSVSVVAKATPKTSSATTAAAGTVCILLTSRNSQALLVNSGATVNAANCEIHVQSSASGAAIFNSGTTINSKKICIKSASIIDNGGTHPNLEKGCLPANDPYATTLPAVTVGSCTYNSRNIDAATYTFLPGVHCGGVNFNNSHTVSTFSPGLYIIRGGDWNIQGTLQGTDVTFYFADSSKFQFNSGAATYLKAPTTGIYANILMYETTANTSVSQWPWNDSPGHELSGLIHLPSRQLTMNSGMTASLDKVTIVADSLILNQTTWNLSPDTSAISNGSTTTTTTNSGVFLSH